MFWSESRIHDSTATLIRLIQWAIGSFYVDQEDKGVKIVDLTVIRRGLGTTGKVVAIHDKTEFDAELDSLHGEVERW